MFQKRIVIDCKGHLLGRLASIIAKQLLAGQRIVCVRCEQINISGPLYRNKVRFMQYLHKRCLSQPARGPFHKRSPGMILKKAIRGMIRRKIERGERALRRLRCFEGIPPAYQHANRVVVPAAFRVTKLKPGRKYTVLGDLAKRVGWKYEGIVQKLEAKRIRLGKIAYAQKKFDAKLRAKAVEEVSKTDAIKKVLPTIQAFAF